jgi:hypothetical protein
MYIPGDNFNESINLRRMLVMNFNWGTHPMPGEKPVCFNFGPLHLWCKRTLDEIWIAHQHLKTESIGQTSGESAEPPGDLNWQRWSFTKSVNQIQLLPAFPDLPVVLKPDSPFYLTRNTSTKIYVRVPLWVRVLLGETIITEIPTMILSKTWFGNFVEGEICYWISSSARKKLDPDLARPYLAICPIRIVNRSDDELLVDKICHQVKQLMLFLYENQLWSNETKIQFRGKNDVSEIESKRKPPSEMPRAKLFANSRSEGEKSFTAKTFESILEIAKLRIFSDTV